MSEAANVIQDARNGVGYARRSRFFLPVYWCACPGRAQRIAVRKPWQRVRFARYTMAPGSGWNGGRDQNPVWALPGQCLLSDYLRIPSLPITSR
jgi:hypothetical protein